MIKTLSSTTLPPCKNIVEDVVEYKNNVANLTLAQVSLNNNIKITDSQLTVLQSKVNIENQNILKSQATITKIQNQRAALELFIDNQYAVCKTYCYYGRATRTILQCGINCYQEYIFYRTRGNIFNTNYYFNYYETIKQYNAQIQKSNLELIRLKFQITEKTNFRKALTDSLNTVNSDLVVAKNNYNNELALCISNNCGYCG